MFTIGSVDVAVAVDIAYFIYVRRSVVTIIVSSTSIVQCHNDGRHRGMSVANVDRYGHGRRFHGHAWRMATVKQQRVLPLRAKSVRVLRHEDVIQRGGRKWLAESVRCVPTNNNIGAAAWAGTPSAHILLHSEFGRKWRFRGIRLDGCRVTSNSRHDPFKYRNPKIIFYLLLKFQFHLIK